MRKYLDRAKIDYVIEHLKLRCKLDQDLVERIIFLQEDNLSNLPKNRIVFPLSAKTYREDKEIGGLAILYPIYGDRQDHYFWDNGCLVFSHDIFKEIFCLQTLYYEQEIVGRDRLGRIRGEDSLNYRMNFLRKPIVDYLYELIIQAIAEYASKNNLPFTRKDLLSKHSFLLSHDVDRIETYSFYNLLNSFKKCLQKPTNSNFKNSLKHIQEYFRFGKRANPLWDFPQLREIEKSFQIKSTYYFLNRGQLHKDAYYSLTNPKILRLIKEIQSDGNEVALHVTIAGNRRQEVLADNLRSLNRVIKGQVSGVRSHWLRFEAGETADILERLGLKYDTSIGHFSQVGFRSGTCLPYRLFSFAQNRMLNVWEIPLIYMDCMILDYQNYSQEQALEILADLLEEVKKFRGIYSILWHNGNLAQTSPFGRKDFYEKLLRMIMDSRPNNMTAESLIKQIEETY